MNVGREGPIYLRRAYDGVLLLYVHALIIPHPAEVVNPHVRLFAPVERPRKKIHIFS